MATGPENWLAFQAWGLEFKPKHPPERTPSVEKTETNGSPELIGQLTCLFSEFLASERLC